jgi:hypothetical protein
MHGDSPCRPQTPAVLPQVRNAPIAARFLSENLQEGRFEDRLLFNSGAWIFQFHPYISTSSTQGDIISSTSGPVGENSSRAFR